jgi:hypothetical protein
MTDEFADKILANLKRRPAVIKRDEQQLEYETLEDTTNIVETDKGKYVIREYTVRVTTRHLVVREFDPEVSYHDALHEFTQGGDKDADA